MRSNIGTPRIRTRDVIHTNVEGLFQQLPTAFVAATRKSHGGTTSKRHQTSGHDGTPTSILAPCLCFRWDVIAIRRNHSTFTNAYEKSNIISCPEHCQNDIKEVIQTWCTPHGRSFITRSYVITRRYTAHLKFTSGKIRNNSRNISRMSRGLPGRNNYWNTIAPWCHLHV